MANGLNFRKQCHTNTLRRRWRVPRAASPRCSRCDDDDDGGEVFNWGRPLLAFERVNKDDDDDFVFLLNIPRHLTGLNFPL